jgi:hypothetical protein
MLSSKGIEVDGFDEIGAKTEATFEIGSRVSLGTQL